MSQVALRPRVTPRRAPGGDDGDGSLRVADGVSLGWRIQKAPGADAAPGGHILPCQRGGGGRREPLSTALLAGGVTLLGDVEQFVAPNGLNDLPLLAYDRSFGAACAVHAVTRAPVRLCASPLQSAPRTAASDERIVFFSGRKSFTPDTL